MMGWKKERMVEEVSRVYISDMIIIFDDKTTVQLNDCHQLPVLSCPISHSKFSVMPFIAKALWRQMFVVNQVF